MSASFSEFIKYVNSNIPPGLSKSDAIQHTTLFLCASIGNVCREYNRSVLFDVPLNIRVVDDELSLCLRHITILWIIAFDGQEIDVSVVEERILWNQTIQPAHKFDFDGISAFTKAIYKFMDSIAGGVFNREDVFSLYLRLNDLVWFLSKSLSTLAEEDIACGN